MSRRAVMRSLGSIWRLVISSSARRALVSKSSSSRSSLSCAVFGVPATVGLAPGPVGAGSVGCCTAVGGRGTSFGGGVGATSAGWCAGGPGSSGALPLPCLAQQRAQDVAARGALVGRVRGQQAVGRRAQRVQVAALVDFLAARLLGRHEVRRAEDLLLGAGALLGLDVRRQAQVRDLGRAGV